jgi:2-oxoglutarate dehydrogenase complex dehydrogenase (E1) component-like enzyme
LHVLLLLQFVSPVVLGMVRAEQTSLLRSKAVDSQEAAWARVLPLHIHGDAAFAGLGVVMESLQLADLPGFSVGGSVHVIINNQVGAHLVTPDYIWSHLVTPGPRGTGSCGWFEAGF